MYSQHLTLSLRCALKPYDTRGLSNSASCTVSTSHSACCVHCHLTTLRTSATQPPVQSAHHTPQRLSLMYSQHITRLSDSASCTVSTSHSSVVCVETSQHLGPEQVSLLYSQHITLSLLCTLEPHNTWGLSLSASCTVSTSHSSAVCIQISQHSACCTICAARLSAED